MSGKKQALLRHYYPLPPPLLQKQVIWSGGGNFQIHNATFYNVLNVKIVVDGGGVLWKLSRDKTNVVAKNYTQISKSKTHFLQEFLNGTPIIFGETFSNNI